MLLLAYKYAKCQYTIFACQFFVLFLVTEVTDLTLHDLFSEGFVKII